MKKFKLVGVGTYHETINEAVLAAKKAVLTRKAGYVLILNTESGAFAACVTDDANGISANKLKGWPWGEELLV